MTEPTVASAVGTEVAKALASPSFWWLLCPGLPKRALRNRMLGEAEVQTEVAEILERRAKEQNLLRDFQGISPSMSTRTELAISSHLAEVEFKQQNREAIGGLALLKLEGSGSSIPKDNPLDDDFMIRFYQYASYINKGEAQKVWANLLAGEIMHPGSFSLKAMDTLRNLSRQQSEDIKVVAPYMFGGGILMDWIRFGPFRSDLQDMGIAPETVTDMTVEDRNAAERAIHRLFADGFIGAPNTTWGYSFSNDDSERTLISLANSTIAIDDGPERSLTYNILPLSSELKELITLDDSIKPNRELLSHLRAELAQRRYTVKVDGTANYDPELILDTKMHRQIFLPMVSL